MIAANTPPTGAGACEPDSMRLLLIEDDDRIAGPLAEGLGRYGFTVERVRTGADALAASEVDLVLLDLGLPDMDGIDVCRTLRSRSAIPIIMITARGEEADRVVGLELGADDYLAKPFGVRELVARIRAVTRRTHAVPQPLSASAGQPNPSGPTTYAATAHAATAHGTQRIGPLSVDRRTRTVELHGQAIGLAPKEFDLLAYLAEDPGAVCSRQQILDAVWDPHFFGPTRTLDVHVAALRRKLGDSGWIATVRGVGFRLTAPADGTPAPADGTPVPAGGTPVPADGTPAPAGGMPAPAGGTPVPADGMPAPAGGTPAPAHGTPVPAGEGAR
jgi:two-component system, OmpR family, response regulator RegX3